MEETKRNEEVNSDYAPKPLSWRQNVIMTIKVLVGAAVLLGLLWLGKSLAGVES
jgi:hypothetical protein